MLRRPEVGAEAVQLSVDDTEARVLRVVLRGRLDAAGVEELELPFTATIAGTERHVLVDLAGVSFIASLGLRMLISAARVASRRGRRLVLMRAAPAVEELFETVGMGRVVPLAASEAEALALLPP